MSKKIEKIDREAEYKLWLETSGYGGSKHGATLSSLADKINEIIEAINKQDE